MKEDILVNTTAQELRVAVVHQGVLQELHLDREATRGLVGNIYVGVVTRVLPGMQSAFIDIGLERAAFLHVADLWQSRSDAGVQPIEKHLYESQLLVVQVLKDPIGTKGARLSTQISIAGRLLVYLPQDPHVGVSQRIAGEAERLLLRERIQRFRSADERGGFIIRTMAEEASDEEFIADMAYLRRRWAQILEETRPLTEPGLPRDRKPRLLYAELSLAHRVLRDIAGPETQTVIVDVTATLEDMRAFARTYMPALQSKLRLHEAERPLFDLHGVEEEIARALARRVDLKSGGYLIFDQTEALTTIDVNTGGYVGGRSFEDTVFRTNLEAAYAICRQLRLRNLGGIIIADFIDMASAEHREAILQELRRGLARDRTKSSVNGFTSLGLVEMTRKRTRESLAHVLCEPCSVCQGKGSVKTARTVCYEVMREVEREARQFNPREFRILASQSVIDLFLDEESQHLAVLGDAIGKPISLHVESLYTQEQYDIVLA
ncbi:MAG TPA: ribonuclease G [Lautropia sp.]|nr:ribonuclease G [Lautropia sp.]